MSHPRLRSVLLLVCTALVPALLTAQVTPQSRTRMDSLVDSVLARMTLEDKLGQLTQRPGRWEQTGPAAPVGGEEEVRAGRIGSFLGIYGAEITKRLQRIAVEESPRKIPLLFAHDVIHGFRTIFPVPIAEASSWDPEAVSEAARIAAVEGTAAGLHWTFAPMVDIARDPRWGRIVEGAGEDPYLGSVMAAARVRGFQSDPSFRSGSSMLATAKHFVAYGAAEGGRDYNVADISPQTLWDVYLPPFRAAIDAGAWSVMASFNEVAGVPMHAHEQLINGVLRRQWGWNGVLVSDYTGVMELLEHGVAADTATAAMLGLRAGVDVDMVSGFYLKKVPQLVREGRLPVRLVDDAVRRVLRAKYILGLFENPYRFSDSTRERTTLLAAAHRAASRRMAQKSIVLLKNENGALPLAKSARRIGVIGALATDGRSAIGNWAAAGRGEEAVTVLDGIRRAVPAATVSYAKGADPANSDTSGFADALRVARESDVVIMVLGEHQEQSAEANNRASLELPGVQQRLLEEVHAVGKPVVLVLMNGRPLAISWAAANVPAVIESWYLGSEMGNALADVLFGDVNPSGKLPATMPRATGQVPLYYNHRNTGRPPDARNKYTSKYIDVPWTPLYAFGHGLSYTTFAYGAPRLSATTISPADTLVVSVDVRNTGTRAGDEVVQLYLRDDVGSLTRPVKELKGFRRISLAPGETKTVHFAIGAGNLAFTDAAMDLVVEPGTFRAMVGTSSDQVQEARFQLADQRGCAKLVLPTNMVRATWPARSARVVPECRRGRAVR